MLNITNEIKVNDKEITYIPIKYLIPYENNARTHSDEQIDKLKNSLKEFGFINPVIIDENNMILVGHGRVMAGKELGIFEVPCIRINHLSEDKKRAYILADNKLSDMAGWDLDLLNAELELIELDMSLFGFENITEEEIEIKEDGFDFEDYEDIPEANSKQGEIYKLGTHYLMCGDSTNAEDVKKLMNGNIADLVVTDPPYNVNITNSQGMTIKNDNMSSDDFKYFINDAIKNMSDNLKPGGAYYIWYGDIEDINFRTSCLNNDLLLKQCLIWVKNQFTLGRQDYQWRHEPCLYGWKNGEGHYFIYDRTQSTVIEEKEIDFDSLDKESAIKILKKVYQLESTIIKEDKPKINDLHPTMKPINLLARLIKNSSEEKEIVLDLFGGSGSTLIACEQLNRKCYMMEYDPYYLDVIIDRWEKFTGEKAVLLNE